MPFLRWVGILAVPNRRHRKREAPLEPSFPPTPANHSLPFTTSQAQLHPDAHEEGGLACTNKELMEAQRRWVAGCAVCSLRVLQLACSRSPMLAAAPPRHEPPDPSPPPVHAPLHPSQLCPLSLRDRAIVDVIKGLGKNLLAGNLDLLKVSLPVALFEPRSYLQKLADPWVRTGAGGRQGAQGLVTGAAGPRGGRLLAGVRQTESAGGTRRGLVPLAAGAGGGCARLAAPGNVCSGLPTARRSTPPPPPPSVGPPRRSTLASCGWLLKPQTRLSGCSGW